MGRDRRLMVFVAACLLCASAGHAQQDQSSGLSKVYGADGRMLVVAIAHETEDGGLTGTDIATGQQVTLTAESVASVRRDVTLQAAVDWAGFAPVAAWLLSRERPAAEGAVAAVADDGIYVNLGEAAGVRVGETLSVVRYPDAGADAPGGDAPAHAPALVAELEAVTVAAKFSICRRTDAGEAAVERGDAVCRGTALQGVAVLPFSFEDEKLAEASAAARTGLVAEMSRLGVAVTDVEAAGEAAAAAGLAPGVPCPPERAARIGLGLEAQAVVVAQATRGSGASLVLDARLILSRTGKVILEAKEKARGEAVTPAPAEQLTIAVAAIIDGASDLVISGNEVYWHHRSQAVPGTDSQAGGVVRPTYVNGLAWQPRWQDNVSDRFKLPVAIPDDAARLTVRVLPLQARSRPAARIQGGDVVISVNDAPAGSAPYQLQVWIGETDTPGAVVLATPKPVPGPAVAERPEPRQTDQAALAERVRLALMQPVTLKAPYPKPYPDAPDRQISVQHAVENVLQQVGLRYSWDDSQEEVGSARRLWIAPRISDMPCHEALALILRPLQLEYEIQGDTIYLKHRLSTRKRITAREDEQLMKNPQD
jgi:hypothetical protein